VLAAGPAQGFGNWVVIDHGNGFTSIYGHMKILAVSAGQSVRVGQNIAYVGVKASPPDLICTSRSGSEECRGRPSTPSVPGPARRQHLSGWPAAGIEPPEMGVKRYGKAHGTLALGEGST
jgi:hypothetical protein